MNIAAILFAPFVLFPGAGESGMREMHEVPGASVGENPPTQPDRPMGNGGLVFREIAESFRIQAQNQVRIEQHMTIRIAPLSRPLTAPPRVMFEIPRREAPPRFIERAMGRCLAVSSISGVQPDAGGRLIFYLRDRRMISAMLDRACRARDFYSGFYMERTSDGQLCVDRDTLLSRSGANCKLTRIRQLVDLDD